MPGSPGGTGVNPPTIQNWVVQVLAGIGNPAPSANIKAFLSAWAGEEGGWINNACMYNPLNTMEDAPGATQCANTITGIKSYADFNSGVNAAVQTLRNGQYPNLLHALQTNDENNLGFNGHPIAGNIQGDLSVWVNGARSPVAQTYINAILSLAHQPGITNTVSTDKQGAANTAAANSAVPGVDALNAIGTFFSGINTFFTNGGLIRILKIAIGGLLVTTGIILVVQELVPSSVKGDIGTIATAAVSPVTAIAKAVKK